MALSLSPVSLTFIQPQRAWWMFKCRREWLRQSGAFTQNAACLYGQLKTKWAKLPCELHTMVFCFSDTQVNLQVHSANELTRSILISCPTRSRNKTSRIVLCHKHRPQENTRTESTCHKYEPEQNNFSVFFWRWRAGFPSLQLEFNYVGLENQTSVVLGLMFRTGPQL